MLSGLFAPVSELLEAAGGEWGIYLEDLQTNEKLAVNENQRFYAASVIKVPIMAAVFAEVFSGKLALEDKIRLRREDLVGGSRCPATHDARNGIYRVRPCHLDDYPKRQHRHQHAD
ncbi:serine hydrolase [Brevibacillus gelatini]